jgi:hypothetical protein
LVRTTKQTADATTLRFAVHGERKLDARPGQFLTFSFLFDGKKETRCYSICSSPARSGYVEITPKRINGGCVSVFLNERASIGMTVEATGPFGQVCLTPHDKKIVAAGGRKRDHTDDGDAALSRRSLPRCSGYAFVLRANPRRRHVPGGIRRIPQQIEEFPT